MGAERILVVEDDSLIALDICSQLASLGYEDVRTVPSAKLARVEVDQSLPDLALLDVSIAGDIDGIELGAELRQNREIPIVYMTGLSDSETVERASKTLPFGYLHKPIRSEDLQIVVQLALEEGKVERHRKLVQDEQRRNERQIMEIRRLDAIATLTAGIAHELNNALQITMGNISLAESVAPERSACLTHLAKANESCQRSAQLIRQLLGFAQRGVFFPEPIGLLVQVADAIDSLRFELRPTTRLILAPETADRTVHFDPGQLRNIIASIILNAEEAIHHEGTIRFDVSEVELDQPEHQNPRAVPGTYTVLRITDTGCGMADEEVTRVFEPFYSRHSKTTHKGLGLSVAYGVMQRHGGWVALQSRSGEGTTVELWFPPSQPFDEDTASSSEPC